MPKLRETTERRRALKLLKDLKDCDGNQSELARREGVSQAAISQRMKRAYVQKTMDELLEEAGVTTKKLAKTISEGLKADKEGIDQAVPDWQARHKFTVTALELKKLIRHDQPTTNVNLIQVYVPQTKDELTYDATDPTADNLEALARPTNKVSPKPGV